jgi:hypothetical protein
MPLPPSARLFDTGAEHVAESSELDGGLLTALLNEKDKHPSHGDLSALGGSNEKVTGAELLMLSSPGVEPLMGLGESFNVLNFLEGIWDESNQANKEEDNSQSSVRGSNAGGLVSSSLVRSSYGVTADPWARAGTTTSRAGVYGIPVDSAIGDGSSRNNERSNIVEHNVPRRDSGSSIVYGGIPLLTPETLLGVSEETDVLLQEGSNEKKDDIFNRDSFYSSLLDE